MQSQSQYKMTIFELQVFQMVAHVPAPVETQAQESVMGAAAPLAPPAMIIPALTDDVSTLVVGTGVSAILGGWELTVK